MYINWVGEAFDTIASLSGKYGQWLNAKGRKSCFIVWSICMLYWSARDFNLGLYSQSVFCLFSLGLNLYGYLNWKKKSFGESSKPSKIESVTDGAITNLKATNLSS